MARLVFFLAALLFCGAAVADAITIVGVLAPYIGGTAAAFVATYGATIALVSYSLISSNQAKRKQSAAAAAQRAGYNASLQDRNVTGLSSEASWQIVYGNPGPIGGSLCAILSSGARDEFKHLLIVFAAHPCEAIDEIYIDGDPVGALDGGGNPTGGLFYEVRPDATTTEYLLFGTDGLATATRIPILPMNAEELFPIGNREEGGGRSRQYAMTINGQQLSVGPLPTPRFLKASYTYSTSTPRVNIQKHLSPGGVDVVDLYINAAAPSAWGNGDRLSGYTYIWITLDQNLARFQGGPPNISARLRGKNDIYDWRTATTGYTANPALCLADFITGEEGFGAALAQIDGPAVIAAANAADASGFRCDGAFRTEQDRESTKQQLEDSFGGTCHQTGGVWRIMPGAWTPPVLSITDADCAAPIQIEQASYSSKERFNTVRGKYIDGAGLGVSADFTPWQNPSHVAADGLVKVLDVSFPFTKDHQRTQDLARLLIERSRGGLTITYPGQMRLWPLQPGDRVSITNAEFGWGGKTFRVTDWSFHPKTPVALQLVEDVAVYYNAAAIITVDAAPNTNLPDPRAVPALLGLVANSGTAHLVTQADGTIGTRVYVQWTQSVNQYVLTGGQVQLQWRLASVLDDVWQNTELQPGDSTNAYLTGLPDGVSVLIRARFVNQLKIPGLWSTLSHFVVGKTEPPPDVTLFSIEGGTLSWSPVVALDLAGYQVRFNYGQNAAWGTGTPLQTGLITESPWTPATLPPGQITLMVKAVDTSGNVSNAPATILAQLGDVIVDNLVLSYDVKAAGFPAAANVLAPLAAGRYAQYTLNDFDTFTRASTATYYDAAGTLQTASPGVARFENARLLIEDESQNLLARSTAWADNLVWSKFDYTLPGNAVNLLPADVDLSANGGSWSAASGLTRVGTTLGPTGLMDAVIYTAASTSNCFMFTNQVEALLNNTRYKLAVWCRVVSGSAPTTGGIAYGDSDLNSSAPSIERVTLPFGGSGIDGTWRRFFLEFTTGSQATAVLDNVYLAADWGNGAQIAFAQPVLVNTQALFDFANITLNDPAVAAPDGSFSAMRVVTTNAYLIARQVSVLTGGASYKPSIFVNYPSGPNRTLVFNDDVVTVTFDIAPAPGWRRIQLPVFVKSTGSAAVDIGSTILPDPIWLWLPQVEPGVVMTSPIVSGATATTRAADVAMIPTEIKGLFGGEILGGNLVSKDANDLFWGDDRSLFWDGADTDLYWSPASYQQLTYVFGYAVQASEAGARLTLLETITAAAYTIEYRYDAQGLFWGNDADYFWAGADADLFWGPPTNWAVWPGAIDGIVEGRIEFRIIAQAGSVRAVISQLALQFDVVDESEEINNLPISALGTRLPLTKTYRSINNLQLTLQADGGSAINARWVDKLKTGPLVICVNTAGAQVAGNLDARVQGVKG